MTTYRVLLPHPVESRLLLMQVHGEWRLPEWDDGTAHGWQAVDHVNRAVAARYGVETTVLRCVRDRFDAIGQRVVRVYELDNHSPTHDMTGLNWIGAADFEQLRVQDPETREVVSDWFRHEHIEPSDRGAPWTRRGWYIEALSWAVAQLRALRITATGTPEQLRGWERSFLMRIPTSDGYFYFKAAPPMFAHEPRLVSWLEQRYPNNVPEVIAVDEERGWFLQEEAPAGALPLDETREEEEWYRAVRRLAEIQVDCVIDTDQLAALGVPRRGLHQLSRRIPRLCADSAAMLLGEPDGLTRREIEQVNELAPTLQALCHELNSYGLPESIEHGDLSAANVLSTLDAPVYLDWSDSSLSHPFFSLSQIMTEAVGLLPASSRESRRQLRDHYLAPWQGMASPETLTRAFEIARVLAPVHLAATTHAELVSAAGHRWEVERAIPILMRTALQLLADEESPLLNSQ